MHQTKATIFVAVLILLMSSMGFAQLSGTYFIDQNASGGELYPAGTSFNTFNDALTALWADGVTGPVIFEVAAGQIFTENLQIDSTFTGASSTNTITFRYQGANKPTIRPATTSPAAFGVVDIRFNGSYFLTFEGLKIQANNGGIQFNRAFRVVWGADDITLRNCEIFDFEAEGVVVYWGGGTLQGEGCERVIVENNDVYHSSLTTTPEPQVVGIYIDGGDNVIVRGNTVHDLIGGTVETRGIFTTGHTDTNDVDIYNNFVNIGAGITSDIKIYGILSQHVIGPVVNIDFNSVHIGGSLVNSSQFTAAVRLTNNSTTNFRNNIVNNGRVRGGGAEVHYAMYIGSASLAYTGDYNAFNSVDTVLSYRAGQIDDLAEWQALSGQDANSIQVDPLFIGADDIHVAVNSPVANLGTPVTGITTDYDGDTRDGTTPDIGADEFPDNTAPTITSTPVTSTPEDQPYSYQAEASDADRGDVLTFSLSLAPEFLNIVDSTGLITGTPGNEDVGNNDVTVVVTDILGLTGTQSFVLEVVNVNDSPTISDIGNQTTSEDTATAAIGFTVDDIDNDPTTLILSGASDNTTLVPVANITFGGSGTDRTVTVTPAADQTGTAVITVTVSDGDSTASDAFTLTVNAFNDPPVVTDIPNQTVDEGSSFTAVNLNTYVSDVDNADNEISWNFAGNTDLGVNITLGVAVISIPNSEWNGDETITFTATDPGLLSDSDAATFTVSAVNDTPVVADIPGETIAEGGTFATISLDDFVTDIDNTDAEILWSTSATTNISVAIANRIATITVNDPDWNGDETVTFTAANVDGASDSDPATFTVTAINDTPVVADIPNQSILEGGSFTTINLDDFVADVDNPDTEIDWVASAATNLTVSIVNRVATITPIDPEWNGDETVTFTASDLEPLSDNDDATFTVTESNDPPAISATDSLTTPEETALTILRANVTFTDPDNTVPDDHTLIVLDGTNYTREGDTITPVADFNGDLTVPVRITDGIDTSAVANMVVTVTAVNDVPLITDQAVLSTPEETALEILLGNLTFTDPDDTEHTLIVLDGTDYTRTDNTITPVADFNGDLTVPVQVTDGTDTSAVFNLTVAVTPINDGPVFSEVLPDFTFNEDDSLLFPIVDLFDFVEDKDTPDSLLLFDLQTGDNVTVGLNLPFIVLKAGMDWFGKDTLVVTVTDGLLADTAEVVVTVNSVNDAPVLSAVPDTVTLINTQAILLPLGDYVSDVDSPVESLTWDFSVSDDTLKLSHNQETDELTLTAPGFIGFVTLTLTVTDDSSASAVAPIVVNVIADPSGIEDLIGGVPIRHELFQNYPNPFNPTTNIKFNLPKADRVLIEVYNIAGQRIATVMDEFKSPGRYTLEFDASRLSSGIYFYSIQTADFNAVRKMILLK